MAEEKNIPGVATEKESDEVLEEIRTQTKEVLKELLAVAKMKPGQILVVAARVVELSTAYHLTFMYFFRKFVKIRSSVF